jgi:hypothetical protein
MLDRFPDAQATACWNRDGFFYSRSQSLLAIALSTRYPFWWSRSSLWMAGVSQKNSMFHSIAPPTKLQWKTLEHYKKQVFSHKPSFVDLILWNELDMIPDDHPMA